MNNNNNSNNNNNNNNKWILQLSATQSFTVMNKL